MCSYENDSDVQIINGGNCATFAEKKDTINVQITNTQSTAKRVSESVLLDFSGNTFKYHLKDGVNVDSDTTITISRLDYEIIRSKGVNLTNFYILMEENEHIVVNLSDLINAIQKSLGDNIKTVISPGEECTDIDGCVCDSLGTPCPEEGKQKGVRDIVQDISDSVLGTTDNTSNNNSNTNTTNTIGSGYITYLPEYGFFDMEIEGLKETDKVEGNTLRIFYVETNGVEGFQMPSDPDNPKETEDIMLQSNSLNITYKKSAEVMPLNLKRGTNLVSFNYIPKIENNEYSKASNMLKWLVSKGARVEHISYFSGGRWKGIGYVDGKTTGDDFNITPGKGYLIYTEADATVSIPGYRITSSVPVPLSAGWNLVGIHGYSQMYTARSFIDSINSVEGLTANNVSWWPTSKGKYEGLQVVDGKQYGFDFSLSSSNGYFVRISKFSPKDSKCKSLLWHAGGSHNGACGGSK